MRKILFSFSSDYFLYKCNSFNTALKKDKLEEKKGTGKRREHFFAACHSKLAPRLLLDPF
jgi:hypothetical protein